MFSNETFQAFANSGEAVFFAAVMTKIEGREHDALLRTYGFRGFPSMAILDAEGNKLYDQIPRSVYGIESIVRSISDYVELGAKVAGGEEVDLVRWFLARLGMGDIDLEEAQAKVGKLPLTDDQRAWAETRLFALEMDALQSENRAWQRENRKFGENKPGITDSVYEAFKAGKRLPAGASTEDFVADTLVAVGMEKDDSEAFLHGFEVVAPRTKKEIAQMTSQIADFTERAKTDDRFKSYVESLTKRKADTEARLAEIEAHAAELKK